MADEYIRKADAKDALQEKVFHNLTDEFYGAMQVLDELPHADVVPVVRCKDCKFYTSMRPDIKTGICDLNVHHMGDDGFCSCGEGGINGK